MAKIGTILRLSGGEYEIVSRIGEGNYGVVWEARRAADGLGVAVKTVQTHAPEERVAYSSLERKQIAEALRREIAFLGRFSPEEARRSHIVPMIDRGEHEGLPVMALALCDESLSHVFARRKEGGEGFPFDGAALLRWLRQIATALRTIHRTAPEAVVAAEDGGAPEILSLDPEEGRWAVRDLNFKNILVLDGDLFLTDFGTVKELRQALTRSVAGTPDWAAPETLLPRTVEDGKPVYALTPRMDVYALGLAIHALVAGGPTEAQSFVYRFPHLNRPFGSVGGLTPEEKIRLAEDLRRLFQPGGTTLLFGGGAGLPCMDTFVDEFVRLVAEMLAPLAEDRPRAMDVLSRAEVLGELLAPTVDGLALKLPERAAPGERISGRVGAKGRGLPRHGRWFQVLVNERPVSPEFRLVREDPPVWEFELAAPEAEGEHEVAVHAWVHGTPVQSRRALSVEADAEQLWAQGRHGEALAKTPGRTDWLDALARRSREEPGFLDEYLALLETVREAHPEDTGVNLRYWEARNRVESRERTKGEADETPGAPIPAEKPKEAKKEQKGKPKKRGEPGRRFRFAAVVAAVLILSLAGAFSWSKWRDGETETDGIACAAMADALKSGDWDEARRRLEADRSELGDCLPADEIQRLDRVFQEMEAGQEQRQARPETAETLAAAVAHYEAAREAVQELDGAPNLESHVAELLAAAETRRDELAEWLDRQEEAESARAAWREIEGLLDAGEWERAQRRFAERRELLARHLPDESQRLEPFFQEMEAAQAQRQARPETVETLTAAVAGYEKAKEAAGRLEMAPNLENHVAELLAATKARRDELAEARAREAEAESARAAWREIEDFLDDGEWERARSLFRERRQVLARHLAEPSERLAEFFESLSGAVETLKRSQASDAEIAAAEAELNAAKETEFGRRMAAFIDAETRRAANLRAERERVRAAEAQYDEIVRLTNDEKWPEAQAVLDREWDSIRADLDSDRNGNLEGLARFFRLVEKAEAALERRPETIETLETAIARYRETLPVARALPADIRLLRPVGQRLRRIEGRRDELAEEERRAQQADQEARRAALAKAEAEVEAERQAQETSGGGGRRAGEIMKGPLGMAFAWIPAGSFMMGSPENEPERDDDEKRHRVTLTEGFWMQTTETTQGQWKAVMGNNPSRFSSCGNDCPVERVSWNDVQEFIKKLNGRGQGTYRLPTEAQWEYAARARTETAFHFGACLSANQANYDGNYPLSGCSKGRYRETTIPGGSLNAPNAWGLHDMHGNVWEWVADWYGDYPSGSVTDPTGPRAGSFRVGRGGSWLHNARYCRSANRILNSPGYRFSGLGFRLSRQP